MIFCIKLYHLTKNFLAQFALLEFILEQFIFISAATAQTLPITTDGSTNTQVTQTASGIDQINISTPNSSELSHNKFTDYNVNYAGQIINNFSSSSNNALTSTQIGGLVTANPNLVNSGSAKIILNEVTSSNVSQLLGYTEIAGTKADLILANPNGIACSGCGFINTARLLMVAGNSNFDANGNLGFNLKEQVDPNLYVPLITVDGFGLDVSRTSSTDIIASSVKLLSSIYGSDNTALTIQSGRGRYDFADKEITGDNSQNNTQAVFAIDASALAKIQSGQIYLIATKKGVGVNMAAEILASSTINIDANGDVYYSKISAGDSATLKSSATIQSIDSDSKISAPTLNLQGNEFKNLGLVSAYNLNIKNSATLNNFGNIEALSLNLLNVTNINNSASIYAENSLNISGTNLTNNSTGNISSPQNYSIILSNLLTNSGLITSANDLTITTNQLINNSEISAFKNLTITATSSITNSNQILANSDLIISANNITNNSGSAIASLENDLTLTIAANLDNSGLIKSFGATSITADSILNQAHSILFSNSDFTIIANSSFTNSGSILSNSKLDLTSATTTNNNEILTIGNLKLTLTDSFTNFGTIISGATFDIISSDNITNSGSLKSGADFTSNAASFTNSASSLILSGKNLNITAASIINKNTKPSSSTNSGIISLDGNIILKTNSLNNNAGLILGKSITVDLASATTNSPQINSLNKTFIASAVNFSNSAGTLFSNSSISLDLGASDQILTGTITAYNIDITANNIINQANVTASDYIKLNATGISGVSGSGNITNEYVGGDVAILATLEAGTYINFTAKNNINNYGVILGATNTTLTSTSGNIYNYSTGKIKGGSGTTTINALNGSFNNSAQTSIFTANNDAIFNTNDLNNNGEISVANDLTANISNNLNNNATSLIWSGNDSIFNVSNTFTNDRADIYSDHNLTIQKNNSPDSLLNKTATLLNISGNIETYDGDLTIKATNINNSRSELPVTQLIQPSDYAYPNLVKWTNHYSFSWGNQIDQWCDGNYCGRWHHVFVASAPTNSNSIAATISSGANLTLNSTTITNDMSGIYSANNMNIVAQNISNNTQSYNGWLWEFITDSGAQFNQYYELSDPAYAKTFASYIKAGGVLSINQNGIANSSIINATQNSLVSGTAQQANDTSINQIDIYSLSQTGVVNVDLSSIISAIGRRSSVNINPSSPTNNFSDNFKINLDSAATTPLVESRSQFTDISKFFGSSYYFDQLGLNGAAVLTDIDRQTRNASATRILGDSFVETKLILDQLKTLTNDSLYLSQSITDANAQIKELLDNSVNQFAALGLNAQDVAIKGLTTAQANSLTKDIVTFELTKVNGLSVLAPKIYLSLDTRNRLLNSNPQTGGTSLANSSTIFGKDSLTINSPYGNLLNGGSIKSGGNLTLNLASLTNKTNSLAQSQIIAGNNLSITTSGNIKNIGANIGAIGTLSLTATNGSILNSAIVQTNDANLLNSNSDSYQLALNDSARTTGNISSSLLQNSSIKGGSISINAGNDFVNLGGKISTLQNTLSDGSTSTGNLEVVAGNNVDIKTLQLRNRVEASWGSKKRGGTSIVDTTTNIGSDLTSVGTLSLTTTGTAIADAIDTASNINIVGSNITSSGNMSLVARDNVTIASAIDTYNKQENNHKKGFQSKSTSTGIVDTTTNISSNLISGGDLSIMSGVDTNIIASNLSATGSGNILAGEYLDLTLTSPTYNTLVTNDNGNVNILNGVDTRYSYLQTNKTKMGFSLENAVMTAAMVAAIAFSGGASAGVILASGSSGAVGGAINKQNTKNTITTYDETVVASKLNFGNNLTISSINDATLKAAKVNSGSDLTINAGNNLLIETASETHSKSNEKNNKGNYFFSNGTSGYQAGNVINTEITSNDGNNTNTTFNIGNITLAQYNKSSGDYSTDAIKTGLDGSILYGDFSSNSKLSYLDKLDSSATFYNPVEEISKSWDQTNRGLTKAGQAVVAITASALTMGAMGPVNGSITKGALVAGSSAAASTASIAAVNSSVNANGDIFKQLRSISKDTWDATTSKESVKNIIIAAAAGGLTIGLTNAFKTGSFTTPTTTTTNTISSNASSFERVSTNLKNSFQEVTAQTISSSAAQSAINGDSFADTIKNQVQNVLIYTAAKVAANEIGKAYHGITDQYGNIISQPTIGTPLQLTLHAGLGCAIGAAAGGNCGSGAIAGVAGEITAEAAYQNGVNRNTSIQLAELSGTIISIAYGGLTNQSDKQIADNAWNGSMIASNAAEHNKLTVWVQEVALGNYHTSIKITPDNQEKYADDKQFQNFDNDGKRYATIGAGPQNFLASLLTGPLNIEITPLFSKVNRDTDIMLSNKVYESSSLVSLKDEDKYISRLFTLDQNYKDNLQYDLFPTTNHNGYNSNSYISGILNAAEITPPSIKLNTPGFDKPVPINNFK